MNTQSSKGTKPKPFESTRLKDGKKTDSEYADKLVKQIQSLNSELEKM